MGSVEIIRNLFCSPTSQLGLRLTDLYDPNDNLVEYKDHVCTCLWQLVTIETKTMRASNVHQLFKTIHA